MPTRTFSVPISKSLCARKSKPRAQVTLSPDGHYQFRQAEPFRLVAGIDLLSRWLHPGRGAPGAPNTFTASPRSQLLFVEDLNGLDVLTADRVVAQIFTEHPPYDPENGQSDAVPTVSFLGTRFDNLTD